MGAAIFTPLLSQKEKIWSREAPKIAIVGGGIAGLMAAYQLKRAGFKASVYEARNRLGGRILSATDIVGEGLVVELGASFINSDHEDILALVKKFNLKLFDRHQKTPRYKTQASGWTQTAYYFEGRRHDAAAIAEQLRPLARQISQDADLIDQNFDRFAPQFDRLSVSDYLNHHQSTIPAPLIRRLLESSIRTEYGVEPEQSSALQLLYLLPTVKGKKIDLLSYSDERFMVEGGNSLIIDRLVGTLSGQIQTGMRLTQIEQQDTLYHLTFAEKSVVEANWVILALPFPVLRQVNLQVKLPTQLHRFIHEGSLGSNEKLIAGFNSRVWQHPQGFAEDVWTDLGFSEAWQDTQRQPSKKAGAMTFFFGAKEVPPLQSGSVVDQGEKILDSFEKIIPGAKGAANHKFSRTGWAQDPFTQGGYSSFKPGQLTQFRKLFYVESNKAQERQDVRVGNLLFAGEQLSQDFYGFMNGGAQTGRLAAQIIIREQKSFLF